MNFYRFGAFQTIPHPLRGSRPCHKGAMSRCDFRRCATEKAKGKFKTLTPKTAEKRRSRTLPQSPRDSSLSEGAFVCAYFFLCDTKKANAEFKFSKLKVFTFVFCGTAARKHKPSSGRKVSRGSVTEGARETERQQKAAVFRGFSVNPSPASREPPLPQGSHGLMQISALCRRESKGEI